MKRILRSFLLAIALLLLVWLAVIIRWRMIRYSPDGADFILWFLIFPLGLVLGYWVLKKFFDVLKPSLASLFAGSGAAAASSASATQPVESSAPKSRTSTLKILGGAVLLPQAADSKRLIETLWEPVFSATTSAELQDEEGKPLIVTSVPELDIEPIHESLLEWRPQAPAAITAQLERTLALASQVLRMGFSQWSEWSSSKLTLRLVFLLPTTWTEQQRLLATAWLQRHVQEHYWPKESLKVVARIAQGETALMSLLNESHERMNQQGAEQLLVVLAADSMLDQQYIRSTSPRWFASGNDKGVVAGEGAALLCLTHNDVLLPALVEQSAMSVLHRCAIGVRDKSAESSGAVDAALLNQLGQQALSITGLTAASITQLVADTDHRGRRLGEMVDFAARFQQGSGDAMRFASVGSSMGHAGAAGTLAALAAAHHVSVADDQPVLFAATLGATERAVVLLTRPATEDASSPVAQG